MPIHDAYLRRTPFERLLPDPDFPSRHFDAIEAEAEERGLGLADPGAFAMLEATGAAVEELRKPGADASATHTHAILLFHAFHLQRSGAAHGLVSTGAARWVVEAAMDAAPHGSDEVGRDRLTEERARYWQLPQHLFWVRVDDQAAPTSLDGIFRTVTGDRVHVLGVMNVFDGAPGFDILPVPPAPLSDLPGWATIEGRIDDDSSGDFESSMPGADLEALYEIRTVGELLKLLSRIERLAAAEATLIPRTHEEGDGGPSPSSLAHQRLVLTS
ncbi:MAG TPA: hypothetical protein VJ925_10435 [Longimicrobiales bacterium]|nr:hypothetical protein [Longimicrobiales bacterium]